MGDHMTCIPLQSAVVCLNCEAVSDTPLDTCPACGGRGLLNLAAVLNRETEPEMEEVA